MISASPETNMSDISFTLSFCETRLLTRNHRVTYIVLSKHNVKECVEYDVVVGACKTLKSGENYSSYEHVLYVLF